LSLNEEVIEETLDVDWDSGDDEIRVNVLKMTYV